MDVAGSQRSAPLPATDYRAAVGKSEVAALGSNEGGIRSLGMDANQPGLFELPDPEPRGRAERSQRGRNRETWAMTTTAKITITDAEAVREAFAQAEENAITIGFSADPADGEPEGSDLAREDNAFNLLAWLIWPTDGLDELEEVGAIQILSVESEAMAESIDEGSATWTATVKLTDVDELRRVAVQAKPEEAELIARSLPVAWQCAADVFAPLRSIPGIAWQPGQVDVEHVLARAPKSR